MSTLDFPAVRGSVTDPSQRIGTVVDGRFRLEKLLGVGGMGAVYVASATNGHRYAVKLLAHDRFAQSREMVARFVREAKLAASVEAPNVVKTYDCSIDPATGAPLMAMELLDGYDADSLVTRLGPIDPTVAVRLVLQAARGLAAAHHAGIIHRDIKPANLFLHRRSTPTDRGREIVVKVCDFGIAKAIVADDESLTVTGTPLGTPLYLSPEQMRSAKHVDQRTDVWSLGMTLWTLLAGRPALGAQTSISECRSICSSTTDCSDQFECNSSGVCAAVATDPQEAACGCNGAREARGQGERHALGARRGGIRTRFRRRCRRSRAYAPSRR